MVVAIISHGGDNASTGHTRWTHTYRDTVFFTGSEKTFILSDLKEGGSYATRHRFLSPNFSWNDDGLGNDGNDNGQPLKIGFADDKGKIGVKITGPGNSRNDILNALLASSDYDNLYCISGNWASESIPGKLDLLGTIYGDGTGEIEFLSIELLAGGIFTPDLNWCLSQINNFYWACIPDFQMISNCNEFVMRSGTIRYLLGGSNNTIKSTDSLIYDGKIDGWSIVKSLVQCFLIFTSSYARNLIFTEAYLRLFFIATGQTTDLYFENLSFFNNELIDYDIELIPNASISSDRIIYIDNCFSDRSAGQIVSKFYNDDPGTRDVKLHIRVNIDFKITDPDGVNLENVFVSITDNNDVVYSGLTNGSGELTLTVLWYKSIYDSLNANGLYSKNEDQGPFTLAMTKTGYMDYKQVYSVPSDILKEMAIIEKEYYELAITADVTEQDLISTDVTEIEGISVDVT